MSYNILFLGLGGTLQQGVVNRVKQPKYTLDQVVEAAEIHKDPRFRILTKQLANKDSTNLDESDVYLYSLLSEIYNALNDPKINGVLVAVGTDRMVDVASLVEFSISPINKPVIFTGSMHTTEEDGNDVRRNLSNSLELMDRIQSEKIIEDGQVYSGVIIVMGNYATYGHSAVKIRADDESSIVCAWNRPLGIFEGNQIRINRRKVQRKIEGPPEIRFPSLRNLRVEEVNFSYHPNLDQLVCADAVLYVGIGDGNFPDRLRETMGFLSSQFYKPQVVCSSVPIRDKESVYQVGQAPDGVVTTILPKTSAFSKLAVALGLSKILRDESKREFIKSYMIHDVAGEFAHLRAD